MPDIVRVMTKVMRHRMEGGASVWHRGTDVMQQVNDELRSKNIPLVNLEDKARTQYHATRKLVVSLTNAMSCYVRYMLGELLRLGLMKQLVIEDLKTHSRHHVQFKVDRGTLYLMARESRWNEQQQEAASN